MIIYEPPNDKTNEIPSDPSEDSDQPRHPPKLISLCCLHEETLGPWLSLQCTVKTDQTEHPIILGHWADAQSDPSLR